MPIESESPLSEMKLDGRIGVLRALADPLRFAMANALLEAPHCVEELAERFHRAPSTICFHLRKLEEANLVSKRKTQYYVVYELRSAVLQETLASLIAMPVDETGADTKRMSDYRRKVVSTFFRDGVLAQMPKQWRKRRIVLEQFICKFERGREYLEQEVNQLIAGTYSDYCTIRRMLVDEGLMTRDGSRYTRVEKEVKLMETRSELKRRYKESPKQAGIFLITNTSNGKVLLGSSANLHGPLNKHRFLLSTGGHWIKQLQEDWNRYGANSFRFEVVEVVQPRDDPDFSIEDELSLLEEIWLEKTKPFGERGYNKDSKIRE